MHFKFLASTAVVAVVLAAGAATAGSKPFGTKADAAYAQLVWDVMVAQKLAGDGEIHTYPYEGTAPHGKMLETFYSTATVDGHTGILNVKRNYGPAGVTDEEVLENPGKHLGAVTVMFQREDGYDPDNQNWFWVKYLPDGSLAKNPKGMQLAGRVAKGMNKGCIACHSGAPGGNYMFTR